MAKKLVYIISDIDKALEFEWAATYLSPYFDMQFILLNPADSDLENFLKNNDIQFIEYYIVAKRIYYQLSKMFIEY
jgi:hypothetical protein